MPDFPGCAATAGAIARSSLVPPLSAGKFDRVRVSRDINMR